MACIFGSIWFTVAVLTAFTSKDDLAAIFGKVKKYMGGALPDDFMAYLEVITGGEADMLVCNYNNYQYTNQILWNLLVQNDAFSLNHPF